MCIFISILEHYHQALRFLGWMTPISSLLLAILNYFWTLLPYCALLPISIFNLSRRQGDMHADLIPLVHLWLPGNESQYESGNTNVQKSESAVPNNEMLYQHI